MKSCSKFFRFGLIAILLIAQMAFGLPAFAETSTSNVDQSPQKQEPTNSISNEESGLETSGVTSLNETVSASLTIIDSNGNELMSGLSKAMPDESTAFDLLKEITEEQNIPLDTTYYEEFDSYIINNIGSTPLESHSTWGEFWAFYVNGVSQDVGVSAYILKPGDQVSFQVATWGEKEDTTLNASLTITDRNGKELVAGLSKVMSDEATAFDLLKEITEEQNIPLETTYYEEFNSYIINNIGTTPLESHSTWGEFWGFYINGVSQDVGVSTYVLKPGDQVSFKVETWGEKEESEPVNDGKENEDEKDNNPDETSGLVISKKQVNEAIDSTAKFIINAGVITDWQAIAVKQAGHAVPEDYLSAVAKKIKDNNGVFRNITDLERMVIGITAAGGNASNIAGYNLVEQIYGSEYCENGETCQMTRQGTNGVIFGLLAFDSGSYEIPENANWTRVKLKQRILDLQTKDGHWGLYKGKSSEIDMTGMALSALAPYQSEPEIAEAIQRAVDWLSNEQQSNGGFKDDQTGESSESIAQAIIGLTSVGIDPQGTKFTKAENTLVSYLMEYYDGEGQFVHLLGSSADAKATEQGLQALVAYNFYLNGKDPIYQLGDVNKKPVADDNPQDQNDDNEDQKGDQDQSGDPNQNDKEDQNESDQTKEDSKNSVGDQTEAKDDIKEESISEEKTPVNGKNLPDTATTMYNYLLLGGLLLVVGMVLFLYGNKRHSRRV